MNQGMYVIAADIDRSCLQVLRQSSSGRTLLPRLSLVRLDAALPLPFKAGVFDLVVVIHPPFTDVVFNAASTVRKGGHLIFETFGAQGENWRALPQPGHVAAKLSADFDALVYSEGGARIRPEAVTVKGLFRRR